MDFESSAFAWIFDPDNDEEPKRNEQFPDNYVTRIGIAAKSGYRYILVSTHQEVRDELTMRGIPYTIVAPKRNCKDEYIARYLRRGSEPEFIQLLHDNWDKFLNQIEEDGSPVIHLSHGEYIEDVLK